MRRILAAVVLIAACRTASTPPPAEPVAPAAPVASAPPPIAASEPPKDRLHAAVEATVKLYEALGAVDPSACPAAAARARALVAAGSAELTTVRAAARTDRRAEVDALYEAAAPRLAAALGRIDALLGRCAGEHDLIAAIDALTGEAP